MRIDKILNTLMSFYLTITEPKPSNSSISKKLEPMVSERKI